MTFKWILENSPGYAGYLVAGMERDLSNPKESSPFDNRWVNKMAFKKYVEFFEEGRELVTRKKKSSGMSQVHNLNYLSY
ncbi:hypothetical protein DPMN_072046 [Dreissena polymorpha]|uniref:Uncharacterized protein n=1 Tax=Dreissena polymorpha TaxID=45954 RepID=A0A9D3Z8X5_DREPO|nr:hypothetical protein DPMN_072046 [Dreissena polymorpha]